MSTPHKATPEQWPHWATEEQWEHHEIYGSYAHPFQEADSSCILELRARVEALESVKPTPAEPDRITALEQRITELQTLFWAHSHPAAVEPTTEPRQHLFATNDTFIKALNDLAEKTNRSKAEVLRDALNLYIKVVDEWDQGKSIAFVSMDGVQPSEENQ